MQYSTDKKARLSHGFCRLAIIIDQYKNKFLKFLISDFKIKNNLIGQNNFFLIINCFQFHFKA